MSKMKDKVKNWYEEHKRTIRDAVWYACGFTVAIGGIYIAGKLNEKKYLGNEVTTDAVKKR